ncbi:molecular chaperone [Galbibacter orientalis DSM 19592]|uniref:Molecular chaperone n=1 Tax=Galbibacter orientalis DSM 19592 TaxID=926559 RepID=I3C806_9FLAO|nr:anhydro-N-acetylmuramic acid kinase [Galbibacter orientalis]EIJ39749.1 molecular chaperone [Galbibacter orientalis DSM 19592]
MKKENYNVIGVMSGTSLDGIDLVNVYFEKKDEWSFSVRSSKTVSYEENLRKRLKNAIHLNTSDLQKLDEEYTVFLAEIICGFIKEKQIETIDFVASHGHTVFHKPDEGQTYQIGNLPFIAEKVGEKVVCDFRVEDVELGGQGAPLVPIGDKLLFSEYNYCLNLGGFANVSVEKDGVYKAFDICAVNNVLNHYVSKLGFDYDDGGKIAASGNINEELLEELNSLAFYKKPYPKSLGIEWVESDVLPLIDSYKISEKDILRTYIAHTAFQVAQVLEPTARVLVTGGGAYNTFFIEQLKTLSDAEIILPNNNTIEFKEAIIFGLLGVLKVRDEVNCMKSITGASKDHSSGKIYNP